MLTDLPADQQEPPGPSFLTASRTQLREGRKGCPTFRSSFFFLLFLREGAKLVLASHACPSRLWLLKSFWQKIFFQR